MSLNDLKVVFMGTPKFAVPTLKALIGSGCSIEAVVTRTDRPSGRGRKLTFSPVKEVALGKGLHLLQPCSAKDELFIAEIRSLAPDVIVIVAFGMLLPKTLIDIPPMGCVNVHASLLPAYRGAAPINWAVINGEKKTGVTTMLIDVGLDTGEMLLKAEVAIAPEDDALSLYNDLSELGARLLIETLCGLKSGSVRPVSQDDTQASYAPLLKKEDGLIDWTAGSEKIVNRVRGLLPWPTAATTLRGKKLKLFKALRRPGQGEPGRIMTVDSEFIEVAAGEGSVALYELQLEGKKRMKTGDFLKGYPVRTGEKLGT